ncbi:MAG TPA: sulfatase [Myxococcota bacterium]|nr:sulfatase [Myxococcota bacterium]
MHLALALLLLGSPLPDTSKEYFKGLARPYAPEVAVSRDGGPVILIVVDAMRPDHLSPYGSARDTTPNLRALADDGLVLTNYFVNGNWTRPSTATLLTGLPPATHGVERETDRLADEFVTLGEILEKANVPTGAVVGNGNAGSAFGLSRGFNYYADTVKHWKGLPTAEEVTALAVPYVEAHAHEPFFLMLFFVDPHDPYHAPPPYEDMFVTDPSVPLIRTPHWEARKYSAAQVTRMKDTYDGALRYTDAALGAFFTALKRLGVYDKATLLVTADHGEAFGEHQAFLHSHHMYDEIVRAPLIIRAPTMSVRGAYNADLFQTLDLLPSLAAYYGARSTRPLPGVDLFARLGDATLNDPQRAVVCEFNNFGIHRRSIRTYTHKLVYEAPADAAEFQATVGNRALLPSVQFSRERWQAFDLARDAGEHHDIYSPALAQSPAWRPLVETLKAMPAMRGPRSRVPVAKNVDAETYRDLKSLGYVQ